MGIKKIIFEDGSEKEFIPTFPDDFEDWNDLRKSWHLHHQRSKWEQNKIFHHLATDIEEYAKDEFDLIDEDDKDDLSEFTDDDILDEAEKRRLHLNNASIENKNIINENYLVRFAEIINRGNDIEIGNFLDDLEVKYHIK